MSGNLIAGQLTAQPCEKVTGINQFPVDGKTFSLPMYLINGVEPGPTLVITGGVHAAEYASIAAALELGQAEVDRASIELAEAFGVEYLVCKEGTSSSTFSAVAADGRILFLVSSLAINQGDPLLSIGA